MQPRTWQGVARRGRGAGGGRGSRSRGQAGEGPGNLDLRSGVHRDSFLPAGIPQVTDTLFVFFLSGFRWLQPFLKPTI